MNDLFLILAAVLCIFIDVVGVARHPRRSDPALRDTLAGLFGPRWLGRLFYRSDLVRRFVVTVDNLPRRQLPSQLLLIKPPAGHFLTTSHGGGPTLIDARNAKRYTIYARFAQAVNAKKVVAAYAFFYPLFEQEYRILGYPSGSFNDRLIDVRSMLVRW